jgi:hypothetical protein
LRRGEEGKKKALVSQPPHFFRRQRTSLVLVCSQDGAKNVGTETSRSLAADARASESFWTTVAVVVVVVIYRRRRRRRRR